MSTATSPRPIESSKNLGNATPGNRGAIIFGVGLAVLAIVAAGIVVSDVITGVQHDRDDD